MVMARLSSLVRQLVGPRRLRLPPFAISPIPCLSEPDDELLLDEVLHQGRVVPLFDQRRNVPPATPPDASDALRQALMELRRPRR